MKITVEKEVLEQALEALNELIPDVHDWYGAKVHRANAAITAIREALAEQPAQQQEPVAYMNQNGVIHPADYEWEGSGNILTPLYTSPPAQQQELSNGDVEFVDSLGATRKALSDCQGHVRNLRMKGVTYWPLEANDEKLLSDAECGRGEFTRPGAATIEAMVAAMQQLQNEVYALRNKQQSAERGEPVAWGNLANWCLDSDRVLITDKDEAAKYHRDVYDLTPLYTSPPAQQQESCGWRMRHNGVWAYSFTKDAWDFIYAVSPAARKAARDNAPASKPWVGLTDEMVLSAARMLSDRQAAACNVDCGDMWKLHGNDFIEDARAALEAAHGIKEKNNG